MKELVSKMMEWNKTGKSYALARVIQTWGSSPRPVGSGLLISNEGEMVGSVSGGCVEGAVLKEAKNILANNSGKLLDYGVSDDEAWSVGLTCGGKVQVYLQAMPAGESDSGKAWKAWSDSVMNDKSGVMITTLVDGRSQNTFLSAEGTIAGESLSDEILTKAEEAFAKRKHESMVIGGKHYFIHVFPRRSQMIIIGAAHITADLVQLAHMYGFETIVIDPRGAFATNTTFLTAPDKILVHYPSEVLNDYPLDTDTYAVILSHDPKIDDNALHILLRSKVAYIGALGSRKTHEKRLTRLTQAGFSESELARIESPIGVDIHALGAKEIALSIMGGVIRRKNEFK